jgi:hypothetical protein
VGDSYPPLVAPLFDGEKSLGHQVNVGLGFVFGKAFTLVFLAEICGDAWW